MNTTLSAGFADPVRDAQRCFRAVLDAMARPGTPHRVGGVRPPAPLSAAAAAVLLSLVDHETPLWVDAALHAANPWIAFHCGAPMADPARAAFAVAAGLPDLMQLHPGGHESPEASCTAIVQLGALSAGRRFRLSGPGLREPRVVAIEGLPDDFAAIWQRNHALFPRGVDLILCAGDTLTALPRSVAIEEA
ncbi:MAG: phosphonate C-P lyase system protein PhnH [Acetobacteraceae bacterium]